MNQFDLNHQFAAYLLRVELDVTKMSVGQLIETRRAFMGACAQMLVLLTDGVDGLNEQQALPLIEGLFTQVEKFWNNEAKRSKNQDVVFIEDQENINFETLFQKIRDLPKE